MIFYYTSIFDLAMYTHVGHVLMTAHFLFVGYLFIWCMIGIDPGPAQPAYPFRVLMLFVMLGVHAFFGVSSMSSGTLLAPNYWHAIGQTDNAALLADQQLGGAIAWGSGDIPSLLLAVALVFAWMRDDQRRARQLDRAGRARQRRGAAPVQRAARRTDETGHVAVSAPNAPGTIAIRSVAPALRPHWRARTRCGARHRLVGAGHHRTRHRWRRAAFARRTRPDRTSCSASSPCP